MITKTRKPSSFTFTVSDGTTCESIDEAKRRELLLLADNLTPDDETNRSVLALVAKPREAIAILRFGLPRKPRTVKAKKKTASQRIREEIGAPLRAQ